MYVYTWVYIYIYIYVVLVAVLLRQDVVQKRRLARAQEARENLGRKQTDNDSETDDVVNETQQCTEVSLQTTTRQFTNIVVNKTHRLLTVILYIVIAIGSFAPELRQRNHNIYSLLLIMLLIIIMLLVIIIIIIIIIVAIISPPLIITPP